MSIMRAATRIHLVLLALVCACGDLGPRDRSLLRSVAKTPPPVTARKQPTADVSSVIGLMIDSLAPYYADEATIVVRFEDMSSLMRKAGPRIAAVARLLPQLNLPQGTADALLRRALGRRRECRLGPRDMAADAAPRHPERLCELSERAGR